MVDSRPATVGRLRPRTLGPAALFAAVLVMTAGASPVRAQTLDQALAAAYLNNPDLQAQRAQLRADDQLVAEARAGWRPTLKITGETGNQRVDTTLSPTIAGPAAGEILDRLHTRVGAVQLEQPIYNGGRTVAATHQAENTVRAGRATLEGTEESVLLAAATAYLDVVRDQAVVALTANNVKVLQQQLQATRDRERVGELTPTDVYQSQARLARAVAARRRAQAGLASSRARYLRVVGEPAENLSAPQPLDGLPETEAQAVAAAANHNPAVTAAAYQQRAARAAVKYARGARLPSLSLVGEASRERESSIFANRTDTNSVMLSLSVPLYQGGVVGARVRRAMELVTAREAQVDGARQTAVANATAAWQNLQAAVSEIDAYKEQVRAAKAALHGVQQEADVGTRTVLDVLNAQQELLNAQVNLISAQRDRMVAAYELKSVIGQLTAKALALPVKAYDPNRH